MKAMLRFDLPEENNEFMLAKRGSEWANMLFDVDRKLRDCLKHGHSFTSADNALDGIRDFLNEGMRDSSLTFDDLN